MMELDDYVMYHIFKRYGEYLLNLQQKKKKRKSQSAKGAIEEKKNVEKIYKNEQESNYKKNTNFST